MTAAPHVLLVVTKATTRAEIQAGIVDLRDWQRWNPCTAREYDAELDGLLNALLELEPEPA